jgi:cysteine-S-conjugate beta-lyase
VIVERMAALYGWTVQPQEIMFLPGLVKGINLVVEAAVPSGGGVLMQPPVYSPFLNIPPNIHRLAQFAPLTCTTQDAHLRYEIDFDAFEAAITPDTKMFLLCNPHNPVGRVWTRDELERLAEICLRHNLLICSDEIHCDLLMDGRQHVPIASLSPEIAARTVTLMAPSKTFNLAGLACGFAIVQDEALRGTLQAAAQRTLLLVNNMGFTAALAAYHDGADWLRDLLVYLQGNRDTLDSYLSAHLPDLRLTLLEGTYLAWIDGNALAASHEGVRAYLASSEPTPTPFAQRRTLYSYFHDQARVALNEGEAFGIGGEHFLRMNLACPRDLLIEALDRMRATLG